MRILDLPLELIQEILRRACEVRGLRRRIRLRLVNKLFAEEVINVIHIFRLLDTYFKLCSKDPIPRIPYFAGSYLARRVLSEPSNGLPDLLRIRAVAQKLHEADAEARSVPDYVHQLCLLVIRDQRPSTRLAQMLKASQVKDKSDSETHLYVAAYLTQTTTIVERWMASARHPAQNSWMFSSINNHAARHSDERFLAALTTGSDKFPESAQERRVEMLCVVAEAGRLDAVQFIFNFATESLPWVFSRKRRPHHAYANEWMLALMHTPSREVFEFLMEKRSLHCINREFGPAQYTRFLRHCAIEGWTKMAEHYLSLGASVEGVGDRALCGEDRRPLLLACRRGHKDTIKMLLEHQADNAVPALELAVGWGDLATVRLLLQHKAEFGDALALAVAKGHRDVVQELLDHGADIKIGSRPLLAYAIEHENVALFRLLVERGCDPRVDEAATECVRIAEEYGLESMLQLLREHGVNSDDTAIP
ncbi:hypothetical protein HBH53_036430 [Parastagonospora nodorum]|nr:hypothetical protein HBH53_036430 [Parastagonospora nodorum]KAH4192086.1 hypothetical protein HBH42_117840 [Parastagonospora nodorum]KAH4223968.1 hypothetical protein HBI06_125240 [Parastagonospora nodorum]KAH4241616.1 hypothetical protein HBI05_098740 [Parastagonospora nodorum]KAH5079123.1 hypothetical protein HBH95_092620 [Parastagonospora nodorum]